MNQRPFLHIDQVHKRYARVHAVAGISLEVAAGEVLALLGPNGAGKSTLLRMLVGITHPDSGSITWTDGGQTAGTLSPSRSGYLPEDRGLYQDIALLDVLRHFGQLRGMPAADANAAANTWLQRLQLGDRARDKVGSLSKGNQQKVQFVAAVLHRPAFAILDEPFSGLDPLNQELFLSLVRDLRDQGTTVLFSAHQMSLVERLADRVFVMHHGREVLHGTVAHIRERWGADDRLVLDVAGTPDVDGLRQHPAVQELSTGEGVVTLTLRRGHHVGDLLAECTRTLTIRAVRTEHASLHEVYVRTLGALPAPVTEDAA